MEWWALGWKLVWPGVDLSRAPALATAAAVASR